MTGLLLTASGRLLGKQDPGNDTGSLSDGEMD